MTIKKITTHAVAMPFEMGGPKPLFAGRPREQTILFVRVETESGLVGWGEAFGFAVWPSTRAAVEQIVAPIAVGKDERDIPKLMLELQRTLHLLGRTGPVMYALSGLDIALWDIAGKAAGVPLATLLGGAKRDSLACYASLIRYSDPALAAKNAARAAAAGYGAIKLHEITVEAVRETRAAIGPKAKLMMDCNCPWNLAEARAIAAGIAPYDVTWFEEPIWPPEDFAALATLRRECGVPIAAGENATSTANFAQMCAAGALDYLQPSVTKIGGVSEMMRIAAIASAAGVKLAPHSPYFGPGLLATVHIAAALEAESMIEYTFVDLTGNPLAPANLPRGGRLALPKGPGLGADPDPDVLLRFAC